MGQVQENWAFAACVRACVQFRLENVVDNDKIAIEDVSVLPRPPVVSLPLVKATSDIDIVAFPRYRPRVIGSANKNEQLFVTR